MAPTKGSVIGDAVDAFWKRTASKPPIGKGLKPLLYNVKPSEARNLFTGLRLKKSVTALGLIGIAAVVAAKAGGDIANTGRTRGGGMDVGEAGYMSYDTAMMGRKDLGATGDIVFGLHKMRSPQGR